jgi:hypothetical protein
MRTGMNYNFPFHVSNLFEIPAIYFAVCQNMEGRSKLIDTVIGYENKT